MRRWFSYGLIIGAVTMLPWGSDAEEIITLREANAVEEEAISTSRPSVTDSSTTVPKGSFQIENGLTWQDGAFGTRAITFPETLLRLGLTEHTEFRFKTPDLIRGRGTGQSFTNFGDIQVGLSHHLYDSEKTHMAIIPLLNLPTGANTVSTNGVNPELRIAASRQLFGKWSVASQLGTLWQPSQGANADVTFTPTCLLGYSLTENWNAYTEYAAIAPTRGGSQHLVQIGTTYVMAQRHQFDVRVGTGLSSQSPDLFVGVGYSIRFDNLF